MCSDQHRGLGALLLEVQHRKKDRAFFVNQLAVSLGHNQIIILLDELDQLLLDRSLFWRHIDS